MLHIMMGKNALIFLGTLVQKQHLKDLPDSKISALCVDKQKLTVASGGTLYTFHIDH